MIRVTIKYEVPGLKGDVPAEMVFIHEDSSVSANGNPAFDASEIQRELINASVKALKGLQPFVKYGSVFSFRKAFTSFVDVAGSTISKIVRD